MAVDSVGNWVHRPELPGSSSVVLAAKIENFVFERFLAIPAITRADTAISANFLALVDTKKRYIIWSIAKLLCTVHSAHSDPVEELSVQMKNPWNKSRAYIETTDTITDARWKAQLLPTLQKVASVPSGRQYTCCAATTRPATLVANQSIRSKRSTYVHILCRMVFWVPNPPILLYCQATRLWRLTSGTERKDWIRVSELYNNQRAKSNVQRQVQVQH